MTSRVVVVGGGLAGITAALRCADTGAKVVLLEGSPRLGGLTTSFQRGDLMVDTGQHVFLRCCTAYRALLDRLGVADQVALQPRLDVPVLRPGQRPARLRRGRLPAPLHLAGSLLRYGPMPVGDRVRVARAALALRGVDPAEPGTDAITFGRWLAEHGQSPRAVEALWDLVGIATLNAPAATASLAPAATVFQLGLLGDAGAGDIGWPLVPLAVLHAQAAQRALASAGADVRVKARARALAADGDRWQVTTDDEVLWADAVVLAVPPEQAQQLLPADAQPSPVGWAQALGASPIVNVHVVLDRRVTASQFFAALDSPLQWVFDRTVQSGLAGGGQYLAVSLSAADDELGRTTAQLRETVLPALTALLPAIRHAVVRDFFVTREPQATFRPVPGTAALRPPTATALPGLALAGAWTDTGWPATMEGAVRSGDAAARQVITLARHHRPLVAEQVRA